MLSKKNSIGLVLILCFAILILTIPNAMGKEVSPIFAISVVVMLSVYIVLSFEMVHRASIALLGAIVIVAAAITFGIVNAEESFEFIIDVIDFNTIGLLLGMMIIVAILGETGIFHWIAIKSSKISKGNLWNLMLILCTFTAVASMLVDNVTIILLMVPVTFSVFRILNVSPTPFIIGQVLASNIGGAATLIGDPPNIIIGSAANIDFISFIVNMGPTIAITFAVSLLLLRFIFRKELRMQVHNFRELMNADEGALIKDKSVLKKSMIVLFSVVSLFAVHSILHLEVSVIALGGAAILLVITQLHVEKVLHEVDWSTLIFFTGLFIIVGVAEQAGVITALSSVAIEITGGNPWLTFLMIIWLSSIASAFVDNIPFTATMIPLIHTLNTNPTIVAAFGDFNISPLWWALALGADLGGNGTLIGSSAGVVAAGLSLKYGHHISFNKWFKIGFPFMIITVAVGTVILTLLLMLMEAKL
jgi:Na+/H+ antiporter NhaD/arsenite permease-like protein